MYGQKNIKKFSIVTKKKYKSLEILVLYSGLCKNLPKTKLRRVIPNKQFNAFHIGFVSYLCSSFVGSLIWQMEGTYTAYSKTCETATEPTSHRFRDACRTSFPAP